MGRVSASMESSASSPPTNIGFERRALRSSFLRRGSQLGTRRVRVVHGARSVVGEVAVERGRRARSLRVVGVDEAWKPCLRGRSEPIEGVDGESASTGGLEASGSTATGAGLPSGEMKGLRNASLTAASGGVLTFDLFALLPMVVR